MSYTESDDILEAKLVLLDTVVVQHNYSAGYPADKVWCVVQIQDRECFRFTRSGLFRFRTKREALEAALDAHIEGVELFK